MSAPSESSLGSSRSLLTAVALLVMTPLTAFIFFGPEQTSAPVVVDNISTAVGETRSITMLGGSEVRVSESTKLTSRISDDQQRLRLIEGEATFIVMEDSARPFWVQAGAFRLRAGTSAFHMTLHEKQLTLQIIEGSVRAQWAGEAQILTAGERLEIDL